MIESLSICGLLAVVAVVAPSAISYGITQRGLNSSCKLVADCGNVENFYCHDGLCECREGYTIDGSLTRCLKVANGYYDTCEESVQCSGFLGAGGTCDEANRQCVCRDGYHYLHGRCHESRGLNESCTSDEDCFVNADYRAARCNENKVCQCSEDFYQREYSTCRPKAKKAGDDCMLDSDCAAFDEKARCVSNKCALDEKIIRHFVEWRAIKKDKASPIRSDIIVGESRCENDAECKALDHSVCAANNTCVCDRGYFVLRMPSEEGDFTDGCVPEIGTRCDPAKTDLQVEFATCKNNEWSCEIDRVAVKDNRLCRKFTKNIDGACNYPELCYLFGPRAKCENDKCACDETSHWVKDEKFCWKYSKIREDCGNDYDCYSRGDDYSPTCVSKKCTCPEGSKTSDDGGYCYSTQPELGSYCEKAEECEASSIPNVSCEDKKCACAETYFELDGQCVKGLNATCDNDEECKLENTGCYEVGKTKICQCSQDYTVGPDDLCIEKANYKEECTHNVQCSAKVKNTFCNTTTAAEEEEEYDDDDEDASGQCDCIPDHYFNTDACYEKRWLGEECNKEGECFTTTSAAVCRNGVCSCDYDFKQVGRDCKKNTSPGLFFNSWLALIVPLILAAIP